jgi:hypothetical protein
MAESENSFASRNPMGRVVYIQFARMLVVIVFAVSSLLVCFGILHWSRNMERDVTPGQQAYVRLGTRPAGTSLQHVFYIRNPGSTPLNIIGVKTSCSCTVVGKLPAVLAPGERAPVVVRAATGDRTGSWSFSAVILAQHSAATELSIQADLVKRLPNKIEFGQILRGERAEKRVNVTPAFEQTRPPKVVSIDCDPKYFVTQFGGGERDAEQEWIDIKLKPDAPDGGFDKTLTVIFGDNDRTRSTISVTGWIARQVEASPLDLNFGNVGGSQTIERRIVIFSPYGQPIHFIRLDSDLPGSLRVTKQDELEGANKWALTIALDSRRVQNLQVFGARIVVKCADNENVIPIQCYAGRLATSDGM